MPSEDDLYHKNERFYAFTRRYLMGRFRKANSMFFSELGHSVLFMEHTDNNAKRTEHVGEKERVNVQCRISNDAEREGALTEGRDHLSLR